MSEYRDLKDQYVNASSNSMGMHAAGTWNADPKRLAFVLSRYKFVSKMIAGKQRVLEIGAGDAWASRIVKQAVTELIAIDIDPVFVDNANNIENSEYPIFVELHDFIRPYENGKFNAVYGLDVLEHIHPDQESSFLKNASDILTFDGVAIFGMPSLESQKFSSLDNGHINCKTGNDFRDVMHNYFYNVFMFSMSDEVVHTGFFPMANYLFAIGAGPR